MTEKQGEASSASAKLEEIQNKLKSGAHWFGGKGSELSTVALPRIRAGLDRPLLRWVSGVPPLQHLSLSRDCIALP